MRQLSYGLALILLLGSCVTQKKYRELEADYDVLQRQNTELADIGAENNRLETSYRDSERLLRETTADLNATTARLDQLQRDYDLLTRRYDQLLNQNQEVLSVSSFEKSTLEAELARQQRELDNQTRELRGLERSLDARESNLTGIQQELQNTRAELGRMETELAQRSARVDELENLLETTTGQMQLLRSNLTDALLGFRAEDLQVTERNGKIYVSLSQNLLFPKGSSSLQSEGNRALVQLAGVLRSQPEIDILVEGHTDTDGTADRNWTLSAERAISVAEILINNGMDPRRVIPTGRAYYMPVAPNDTPANKALNRRVEIILTPKLDALYELVK